MASIIWNSETMSTGVSEVDAQHQEWIHRYNQFDEAIQKGKGIEVVTSTLDFFLAYTDTHFDYEENVMEKHHCVAAEQNHVDHEHIRNILHGYKCSIEKHGVSLSEIIGLKIQMEQWLIKHILTVDIQLRQP